MFCLRRAAVRVLCSPSPVLSVYAKQRSITTFAPSLLQRTHSAFSLTLQKRFASDERTIEQPAAPETTSAEQIDIAEIKPNEVSPHEKEIVEAAIESASSDATQSVSESAVEPAIDAAIESTNAVLNKQSKSLYIGNLYFDVTEDMLKREFGQFGNVTMARIIHDSRGLSKGFGYIDFDNADSAAKAIEALNLTVLEGRRMTVQYALSQRDRKPTFNKREQSKGYTAEPSRTLFIGNMSYELSDKDLNDLFKTIRNVIDVRVAIDRRTGQPRGFAHADFVDIASAEAAKEILQSKEFYGRQLRVDFSAPSAELRRPNRR